MSAIRSLAGWLSMFLIVAGVVGCAEEPLPIDSNVIKLAEYSGSFGQGSVKLYMYSGEPEVEDIKAYVENQGCNFLYTYFYPDTVSISEIPVEEIRSAKSFVAAQDILFNGEGYARWSFASQCLAVIPIVKNCNERFGGENCR